MVRTAENLAAECRDCDASEQETLTLLRHEQYGRALADERSFQKRYMQRVELLRGRKVIGMLEADEGVYIPPRPRGSRACAP